MVYAMDALLFLVKYKYIFLFYAVIIIFLIIKWKKIEVQGKIIFLYRMKWGLQWMEKYSRRFREIVILLGYVGTGIGFAGMAFISLYLIKSIYDLLVNPSTLSGVSLVLPGIRVPGLGILPFWHWLLAIFVIALVHEFSHGIVARAHDITVKNTGIVFFGPVIGAFVEPDEKKLQKEPDIKQYSVLAAGSFSNIILALAALFLLNLVFVPLETAMTTPTGFTFDNYVDESYPFAKAGIAPGTIIIGINEQKINKFEDFSQAFMCYKPGDTVMISTPDKEIKLTLADSPDVPGRPFMGIKDIHNEAKLKPQYDQGVRTFGYALVHWFTSFLKWLYLLSFGIGLFNLLPLPIVDGGRMMQVYLHKKKGSVQGERRYRQISVFFLVVLLLLLFYPLVAKVFL